MAHSVLTPLQERVLNTLFDNDLADRGYYLTGGTALSAFYLQHRYSDDLDFFTRKSGPLRNDFQDVVDILTSLAFDVSVQSFSDKYLRLLIRAEDQEDSSLKVEFAQDVPAMMARPKFTVALWSILSRISPSIKSARFLTDSRQNQRIIAISFLFSRIHDTFGVFTEPGT